GMDLPQATCVAGFASASRELGDGAKLKEYCSGMDLPQATCVAGFASASRDLGSGENLKKYCK
ncbi:MAG: hypothetical protein ACXVCL_16045, partial [Bdellovibrio sp.]